MAYFCQLTEISNADFRKHSISGEMTDSKSAMIGLSCFHLGDIQIGLFRHLS